RRGGCGGQLGHDAGPAGQVEYAATPRRPGHREQGPGERREERRHQVLLVRDRAASDERERHLRASYTRLNGVSATRRNVRKPPAAATAAIGASPAWL